VIFDTNELKKCCCVTEIHSMRSSMTRMLTINVTRYGSLHTMGHYRVTNYNANIVWLIVKDCWLYSC